MWHMTVQDIPYYTMKEHIVLICLHYCYVEDIALNGG